MNVCEINIGKAAVQKTVTVLGGRQKRKSKFCGFIFETECSSVNSDCVTASAVLWCYLFWQECAGRRNR
jgi:hypothetical protein